MNAYRKQRLVCPGPTPLLDSAQEAPLNQNIYHRSGNFKQTILECRQMLQEVFFENLPLILTSSGTGAMPSLVNFTAENDKVGIISGGKFGQRWENLANTYGCDAAVFELNWGSSVDLDVFETWVSKLDTLKAFFFQKTKPQLV